MTLHRNRLFVQNDNPSRDRQRRRLRRLLWTSLILLCLIAVAAVVRRIFALAHPVVNGPPQLVELDAEFARRSTLTLLHIVPAMVLVVLVPFQFSRTFRDRHLQVHRWMGRVIMLLGLVVALTAVPMSRRPVGGALEASATLFYDGFFLVALTKAFIFIRRGDVVRHREWVIRAMSIALGVATVRPIMGIFFATSRLTGLTPHDFFGVAFWLGFTITYLAAEAWIRTTRGDRTLSSPARTRAA